MSLRNQNRGSFRQNDNLRAHLCTLVLGIMVVGITLWGTPTLAQHDAHGSDSHNSGHKTEEVGHGDTHGQDSHSGEHAGEHAGEHGEGHDDHLPSLLDYIAVATPDNVDHILVEWKNPIFAFIVIIIASVFFIGLSKDLSARKPGRKQMVTELVLGGLYDLFVQIIGPTARRYTPFLGSLFLFILLNNLFGLIPLGHASTSAFNTTTFALGAITFFFVQIVALKENGLLGYLHHMAGSPKTGMDWGFSLLLFPLHLLGELIKPVSLALRLFGNIFGEEALVATMVSLGILITHAFVESSLMPGIPLQFPFYFLGLLSSTIQALVFTLLATVYIALWLPHGDHDEEHGH
ncbi:MAG: F0F1 ATP synthase subunit A [bacterium]|nr:F0F1 ATP synthase subunit A [bacterium]